jgi:hypothetical protein
MKRLDTTMDTQTGKFVEHARPLGTVTEGMVIKRAKEIAVIKGRNGNDYTRDDFEEARRDLVGLPDAAPADAANDLPDTGGWLGEAGDKGHRAPVRPARDEQTFAEDLVQQGVEEATHDQMLAGSQQSREKDQIK